MPQVERVRSKKPKKYLLLAAGIVVIVAAAGVTLWYLMLPMPQAAVAKADVLNANGDYVAAEKILKRGQWRAASSKDKTLIVSRLAATTQNQGRQAEALKYYLELEKLDPAYSNTLSVAELAQQMGKKDVAKAAFERAKKAAEKLPEKTRNDEMPWLDAQIEELNK